MPGCSPDKAQRYEDLRSQAIEDRRTLGAITAPFAAVLTRQGLGVWLQLHENDSASLSHSPMSAKEHRKTLPDPEYAELLTVLAGLVFNIHNRKESA